MILSIIERSFNLLSRLLEREASKAQHKHERCLQRIDEEHAQHVARVEAERKRHIQQHNELASANAQHVKACNRARKLAANIRKLNEV